MGEEDNFTSVSSTDGAILPSLPRSTILQLQQSLLLAFESPSSFFSIPLFLFSPGGKDGPMALPEETPGGTYDLATLPLFVDVDVDADFGGGSGPTIVAGPIAFRFFPPLFSLIESSLLPPS